MRVSDWSKLSASLGICAALNFGSPANLAPEMSLPLAPSAPGNPSPRKLLNFRSRTIEPGTRQDLKLERFGQAAEGALFKSLGKLPSRPVPTA